MSLVAERGDALFGWRVHGIVALVRRRVLRRQRLLPFAGSDVLRSHRADAEMFGATLATLGLWLSGLAEGGVEPLLLDVLFGDAEDQVVRAALVLVHRRGAVAVVIGGTRRTSGLEVHALALGVD